MNLHFERFDADAYTPMLVHFLTAEKWPFHVNCTLTESDVLTKIGAGAFDAPDNETYWITGDSTDILGLLHLTDLNDIDDGSPGFDLRLRTHARRHGAGAAAVRWISDTLFGRYPQLQRIAATTRADNFAMRRTFTRCGYAKEGQFRQAWPASDGKRFDSLEYSILRDDWATGTVTPVEWSDSP